MLAAARPFTALCLAALVAAAVAVVPGGVPRPSAAAASVRAAAFVTPENYGARGDGVTDDTAALQATLDDAAGRTVLLAAGRSYAHAGVLHLRRVGLHVTGAGTLLATDESQSSVWIEADDVLVDGGVSIRTGVTTHRWSAWEQMGVRLVGHTGITLRNVSVVGSAAAGVYVGGSSYFLLDHVTVTDTRADGIHMTQGAHNGRVLSATVTNSGDDGIAVVSYSSDGAACHDISVRSPRVLGTSWGRGLSVVGGTNVRFSDVDVERSAAAAIYLAAEGDPWYTAGPVDVVVNRGRIVGANTDASIDHGAVVVLAGENGIAPATVTVANLSISDTRATASRDLGVITYGTPPSAVLFSNIAISGGPTSAYQGNTPAGAYRLRSVTKNGVAVSAHG